MSGAAATAHPGMYVPPARGTRESTMLNIGFFAMVIGMFMAIELMVQGWAWIMGAMAIATIYMYWVGVMGIAGIFKLDMQDIGAQQTGMTKEQFKAKLVAAGQ